MPMGFPYLVGPGHVDEVTVLLSDITKAQIYCQYRSVCAAILGNAIAKLSYMTYGNLFYHMFV